MLETVTGLASLRADGIVSIKIRNGAYQSLVNAKENVEALKLLGGNQRRALLINISGAQALEPEVRHFYSDPSLAHWFTALGLVVEQTALGRMMGNLYLRVARARISVPMKLFDDEPSAIVWLKEQP